VEDVIKKHPKIMDAAVVGYPDERLGERVCAFVVPRPGESVTLDEVKEFMKESGVAIYKWPERLMIVDQIPRNPLGKVQKALLKERLKELKGM
jgi:non-ribosomal peptide synthetase component E (peptide arylation enzyme)